MCYNRAAVGSLAKQVQGAGEPASAVSARPSASAMLPPGAAVAATHPLAPGDDISRYCPVCSQRLDSRHCKLVCTVCGYYMSCADFY
jgi:hypothetical protein